MSELTKSMRLIAAAEAYVSWEAILVAVNASDAAKQLRIDVVPPVEISCDGDEHLSFTFKIYAVGSDISIFVEGYDCSCPSTLLELKLIETEREHDYSYSELFCPDVSSWQEPSHPKILKQAGSSVKLAELYAGKLRCFTAQLKVYAETGVPPTSLASRLNQARLDGDSQCDASLCVEGTELSAHRLVLSTQSEVFSRMFGGSFKEAVDGRVHVEGVSKGAVALFLEYLYTENLQDFKGLELELLDLAERYCVQRLRQECRLRLWTVDAPRALQLLQLLPHPHVDEDTRKRLVRIVVNDWHVTCKSSEWAKFQAANPLAAELLLAATSKEPPVTILPS